jgi:2-isopropylmalate synthase
MHLPIIKCVFLRDGNQALSMPLTPRQKLEVFNLLKALGVKQIEAGFPAASISDFKAFELIAGFCEPDMVIGALARCVESDIQTAISALSHIKKGIPQLHTFVGMSESFMANVLRKSPKEVEEAAVLAVKFAKKSLSAFGRPFQIQFSPEHFGNCGGNLPWVIDVLRKVVKAGANVINLPNTVELSRPSVFAQMVGEVALALPKDIVVSVHCHNDLGMAVATTIESYFAGAAQLEVCLNGLGERAGNASLYSVAVALHRNGVSPGINLKKIYEIALKISAITGEPIPPKEEIIGEECFDQKAGIHQDGAIKTKMAEPAYLPFKPSLVGRKGGERLKFTSQSGHTAVYAIIRGAGFRISKEQAKKLQPILKSISEKKGVLSTQELVSVYKQLFAA